jgi:hypothetical protein
LGFFNPLVARGARAMGIPRAFETWRRGGTAGQDFEAAQRDMINTWTSPVFGPPARFATIMTLGTEPYIADFRDKYGNWAPRGIPAIPPTTKPGYSLGERALAASLGLNAFYNNVGEATGALNPMKTKGAEAFRMFTDLIAPNLIQPATNPYAQASVVRTQQSVYRRRAR